MGGRPLRSVYMTGLGALGRSEPVGCQLTSGVAHKDLPTFSPRHESHALGRLKSPGDLCEPGVSCALLSCVSIQWELD